MRARATILACVATTAVLAGCGERAQPLEPPASDASAAKGGADPVDISGNWLTSGEYFIQLSEESAPLFGVQPEGTRTRLDCEYTGTFAIVQIGAAFSGSYTETGECETQGGQSTQVVVAGDIVGGTIRGNSVHFSLVEIGGPPVECPQQGAIVEVEDGSAVRMQGSGRCIEPGHPGSSLDIPPPRWGPNRTLWEATRP